MTVTLTQMETLRFDPASQHLFSDVVFHDPDGSRRTVSVETQGHRAWSYDAIVGAILAASRR